MAKNNSGAVSVGKPKAEGAVWVAPIGTTLPTNATAALDEAFTCLGYVSEDGLKNGVQSDSEAFKAWGGQTVLTATKEYAETFTFALLQNDEDAMKFIYGDSNVTGSISAGTLKVAHNAKPRGRFALVAEVLLTGGHVKRIVVAEAEITEQSDIEYKHDQLITYEVTVSAYPDETGNTAVEYLGKVA